MVCKSVGFDKGSHKNETTNPLQAMYAILNKIELGIGNQK